MGLLKFKQFSSVPDLFKRLAQRQQQRDDKFTMIPQQQISWLFVEEGVLRANEGSAVNTTTTMFTVPQNRVFYLIGMMLGHLNFGLPTSASVRYKVAGNFVLNYDVPDLADDQKVTSMSLSIPIKMTGGQTIQLISDDAATRALGTFIGYEIDEKLIQERL